VTAVPGRAPLPYLSTPRLGRGITVNRVGRNVVIAGQTYSGAAALELSAAIARAATATTHPTPIGG
jgi:hypothetical protein